MAAAAILGTTVGCTEPTPPWAADCEPTRICDADGCALIVDLPVARVEGTLTYDGAPLLAQDRPSGILMFRPPNSPDVLHSLPVAGGSAEWSTELLAGTYDVAFRLTNATEGIDRPTNTVTEVAAGVDLQDGSVLDIDIPIVSISGEITLPSDAMATHVQWYHPTGRLLASTAVKDHRYQLFSPPGPGSMYIAGVLDRRHPVYPASPVAQFDAAGDTQLDLAPELIRVTGSVAVAGENLGVPSTLWITRSGEPNSSREILLQDGEFTIGMTPGTVDFWTRVPGPIDAYGVVESDLTLEQDAVLALSTPIHVVRQSPRDTTSASELTLIGTDLLENGEVSRRASSATNLAWVFPGRYDVVATPEPSTAPQPYTLASDLLITSTTELPPFPERVSLNGTWAPVERLGWSTLGEQSLSLLSPDQLPSPPSPVRMSDTDFSIDAFVGTYSAWASVTLIQASGARLTGHQKLNDASDLRVDSRLDIDMEWVEVAVDLRINGEPATERRWASTLTLSHHEQPSLQSNVPLLPGEQPPLLLPAGVYDLRLNTTTTFGMPMGSCVVIE